MFDVESRKNAVFKTLLYVVVKIHYESRVTISFIDKMSVMNHDTNSHAETKLASVKDLNNTTEIMQTCITHSRPTKPADVQPTLKGNHQHPKSGKHKKDSSS